MSAASSVAAALLAERLASRVVVGPEPVTGKNAFDETLESHVLPATPPGGVSSVLERLPARGAAFVDVGALIDARAAVGGLVERRCAAVVHVVLGGAARDVLDAHAALDLGAPVLHACDAQDGADLTIVAHRMAEDAEVPVLLLHEGDSPEAAYLAPDAACVRGVLEPAPPPLAPSEGHTLRRVAERAPFALSSAMRAFERFSGRKSDVVRAIRLEGAGIVIVASGGVARAAREAVTQLASNARELPVGLLEVVALRPFPGPAIVKALARARVVVTVERVDAPLAQSSSLAIAVKAAFIDALTWTPGYPGIGRVPTLFSACIDTHPVPEDLLRVIERLNEGELAPRSFVVERT